MSRLLDCDKVIDVLLHERETVFNSCDNEISKSAKFEAVSDCISIINNFPQYEKTDHIHILTVSDVINIFLHATSVPIVLKRCDTGREYRKIKNALDNKNFWEVTGFYPRIVAKSPAQAIVEMVLWCRDGGTAIKDLHNEVVAGHIKKCSPVGGISIINNIWGELKNSRTNEEQGGGQ